jgi:hypothetical protein
MKTFNALLLLSALTMGGCSSEEPAPEEQAGCLTRWKQIMGKEDGISWAPGKITVKLTDPSADEWGRDVVSTEVLYEREDEVPQFAFDEKASGMHMLFSDLDMIIRWDDLVLKDSVYANLGFTAPAYLTRHNSEVGNFFAQYMGVVLFHNRAEIRMPFQETKVIKLPAFPKSGEMIVRRRHSEANTTHNVFGEIILNTVGVKDSLSYDGGSMLGLPYFSLYFTKDAVGTSQISINHFEFVEVNKPVVVNQDAESYTDDFACNSITKKEL